MLSVERKGETMKWAILLMAIVASVRTEGQITATVGDGGSVVTPVFAASSLNGGSKLTRKWVVLHDPRLQIDIVDDAGLNTQYFNEIKSFDGTLKLKTKTSSHVIAYEVKTVLVDVWGDVLNTLCGQEITDIAAGENHLEFEFLINRNEAAYISCITYISRAMTADGKIIKADEVAVIKEAAKIAPSLKVEDLTPKRK
jgi:hypothetical protein